jgi:hypothetical protein
LLRRQIGDHDLLNAEYCLLVAIFALLMSWRQFQETLRGLSALLGAGIFPVVLKLIGGQVLMGTDCC